MFLPIEPRIGCGLEQLCPPHVSRELAFFSMTIYFSMNRLRLRPLRFDSGGGRDVPMETIELGYESG
jgi:hypothetical protein